MGSDIDVEGRFIFVRHILTTRNSSEEFLPIMGKTTPLNTRLLTRQKSNLPTLTTNPTAIDKMLQQAIGAVSSAIESTERRLSLTPLITTVPLSQGLEGSSTLNTSIVCLNPPL